LPTLPLAAPRSCLAECESPRKRPGSHAFRRELAGNGPLPAAGGGHEQPGSGVPPAPGGAASNFCVSGVSVRARRPHTYIMHTRAHIVDNAHTYIMHSGTHTHNTDTDCTHTQTLHTGTNADTHTHTHSAYPPTCNTHTAYVNSHRHGVVHCCCSKINRGMGAYNTCAGWPYPPFMSAKSHQQTCTNKQARIISFGLRMQTEMHVQSENIHCANCTVCYLHACVHARMANPRRHRDMCAAVCLLQTIGTRTQT